MENMEHMEKMEHLFGTKFDKDHKRFNQEVYNNIVEFGWC